MSDLHPAPEEYGPADHRETYNRQQLNDGNENLRLWKRAVEDLAANLQIEPAEAHYLLLNASYEVTKGQAWAWWY